jgi:recombination DNA repair RAD52 pathway protein
MENKELIPIPENAPEEFKEVQNTKYQAALTNLVMGKTPKDVVFQRPVRGGANVDYVPGWWFIEQLNALFGHLWDFEVLREFVGQNQVWVLGKLTVKLPSGLTVTKTAYGGSDIKKYGDGKANAGQIIDIADDLKSASTDAMKKASTLLGLASDIYGKREVLEQTGPNKSHLNTLYKVGSAKGMTKDVVDEYCNKKYQKLPNELEAVLVLGLITELRAKPDVKVG